jgi:hypothetical protein
MAELSVRYYIDPENGCPHIYGHRVTEEDVEDVLLHPGEDRAGREGSRVILGKTRNGRYLKVIYVPDHQTNSVFIITAYELTGKPLSAYKRRLKSRGNK